MTAPLYQCPTTGQIVQGWIPDHRYEAHTQVYEPLTCIACRRVHYVDPRTGKVLDRGPFRICTMKD